MTPDCTRCRLVPCLCRNREILSKIDHRLIGPVEGRPLGGKREREEMLEEGRAEIAAVYAGREFCPWSPELRHKCPRCGAMAVPNAFGAVSAWCPECQYLSRWVEWS